MADTTNIGFNSLELYNGNTKVRTIATGDTLIDGSEFDILQSDVYDRIHITFKRMASGDCSGTIKPMIRLASDSDPTFQPYSQTNRELTVNKADNSVIGTVEDGTNPTKSYAVDEFMVRDGAFCQVTAPVTTSSTWTEGSNYTKKSIAEVLQSLMS